jgi:hypothetical protein
MADSGVSRGEFLMLCRSVDELRAELVEHRREHMVESAARVMSRRWAWGFAALAVGSVWGPLLYLVTHVH